MSEMSESILRIQTEIEPLIYFRWGAAPLSGRLWSGCPKKDRCKTQDLPRLLSDRLMIDSRGGGSEGSVVLTRSVPGQSPYVGESIVATSVW